MRAGVLTVPSDRGPVLLPLVADADCARQQLLTQLRRDSGFGRKRGAGRENARRQDQNETVKGASEPELLLLYM